MRQQLDKQLNRLHVELIKMGSLCEKAISLSAKLLVQRSDSIMREVFAVDSEIDTKEKELESFCMMLLLQQQPVAKDFREVSAALKMVSDLERIGDHAVNLAEWVEYSITGARKNNEHQQNMW